MLVLALALAPSAIAQSPVHQPTSGLPSVTRDSLGMVKPDSSRTVTSHRDTLARLPWSLQPRQVMLRSLLVPGWGQAVNGSWTKAVVIGAAEVAIGAGILSDEHSLRNLQRDIDAARAAGDQDAANAAITSYNDRLDRQNQREWLLGGVMLYSLVDAYVDAHFRGFRQEFEHDPALPDTLRYGPGVRFHTGGARRLRLSVEWPF